MVAASMYEKFAQGTPVCVMIRGSLEYALSDDFVNEIFERTADRQYTRSLLFSDVVDVMAGVVCKVFPSVNAAYQKQRERFSVGRRALYDKLNNVEPRVTRELVRQTAARMLPVADGLHKRMKKKPLLPGFTTRVLDGNHLAATHHRIQELRDIAAGPLPGQVLAVFDPDSCLVVDVFPCEDGHAQERSLLVDVLDSMQPGEAWIADRNFCTSLFLFQTARNGCYFVIRQHARNVRWEAVGQRRKMGRTETGVVYQQRVDLIDDWGNRMRVRRITIKLDRPTGSGDKEIHILTNLPGRVSVPQIAEVYRNRWKIEGVFSDLAAALNCEISSIGYPPAALFAFGTGLVAYNILSIVRTALAAAHGEDTVEEISAYYVADEIHGLMRGLMVAVPDERWEREFGKLTARQMTNRLLNLARQVVLEMFRKHRRGPKKQPPKRTRFRQQTHVSTARILAESRGRQIMH